jgi:hypothetical protein
MNATTQRKPSSSSALLRGLVIENPLFLLSALMVLGGAWLLNPPAGPGSAGRPNIGLLAKLFLAIQLYELALIAAGAIFVRRGGLERDVRNLVLVLAPFLVDVTMTTSTLSQALFLWTDEPLSYLFGPGVFAAIAGKVVLAARLAGSKLDRASLAAILAGPALVTALPWAACLLAADGRGSWVTAPGALETFFVAGRHAGDAIALLGGVLLASLVMIIGWAGGRASPDGAAVRVIAAIVLPVATIHVGGTAWSHSGDLTQVAGPLVVALGWAAPRLLWPGLAARDSVSPFAYPALGVLIAGGGEGELCGFTGWQVSLAGAVGLNVGLLLARREWRWLVGGLCAADLLACGRTPGASFHVIGHGAHEALVLFALFSLGLARRAHPVALAIPLMLGAYLTENLGLVRHELDGALGLSLLGAGTLAWTHREHGRSATGARWRAFGATLVWMPFAWVAAASERAHDVAGATTLGLVLALVVLAIATRLRVYAFPAILLVIDGGGRVAPTTAAGWGAAGIALAFVAVGVGVLVSLERARILAWIERGSRGYGSERV